MRVLELHIFKFHSISTCYALHEKASVYPCLWLRLQNAGARSPDSCSSGRPVRTQNLEMGFLDQVGRRIYYCVIHTLKPTDGPVVW